MAAVNPILLSLAAHTLKQANESEDGSAPVKTPPNLRLTLPGSLQKCQSCKHFTGACDKYGGYPVQPDQICNSYEPKPFDVPNVSPVTPGLSVASAPGSSGAVDVPEMKLAYTSGTPSSMDPNIGNAGFEDGAGAPSGSHTVYPSDGPLSTHSKAEIYRGPHNKALCEGEELLLKNDQMPKNAHLGADMFKLAGNPLMGSGSVNPPAIQQTQQPQASLPAAQPLVDPNQPQQAQAQTGNAQGQQPQQQQPQQPAPQPGAPKPSPLLSTPMPQTQAVQSIQSIQGMFKQPAPPPPPPPPAKMAADARNAGPSAGEMPQRLYSKWAKAVAGSEECQSHGTVEGPMHRLNAWAKAASVMLRDRGMVRTEVSALGRWSKAGADGEYEPRHKAAVYGGKAGADRGHGNKGELSGKTTKMGSSTPAAVNGSALAFRDVNPYAAKASVKRAMSYMMGPQYNRDLSQYQSWQRPPFFMADQYNRDYAMPDQSIYAGQHGHAQVRFPGMKFGSAGRKSGNFVQLTSKAAEDEKPKEEPKGKGVMHYMNPNNWHPVARDTFWASAPSLATLAAVYGIAHGAPRISRLLSGRPMFRETAEEQTVPRLQRLRQARVEQLPRTHTPPTPAMLDVLPDWPEYTAQLHSPRDAFAAAVKPELISPERLQQAISNRGLARSFSRAGDAIRRRSPAHTRFPGTESPLNYTDWFRDNNVRPKSMATQRRLGELPKGYGVLPASLQHNSTAEMLKSQALGGMAGAGNALHDLAQDAGESLGSTFKLGSAGRKSGNFVQLTSKAGSATVEMIQAAMSAEPGAAEAIDKEKQQAGVHPTEKLADYFHSGNTGPYKMMRGMYNFGRNVLPGGSMLPKPGMTEDEAQLQRSKQQVNQAAAGQPTAPKPQPKPGAWADQLAGTQGQQGNPLSRQLPNMAQQGPGQIIAQAGQQPAGQAAVERAQQPPPTHTGEQSTADVFRNLKPEQAPDPDAPPVRNDIQQPTGQTGADAPMGADRTESAYKPQQEPGGKGQANYPTQQPARPSGMYAFNGGNTGFVATKGLPQNFFSLPAGQRMRMLQQQFRDDAASREGAMANARAQGGGQRDPEEQKLIASGNAQALTQYRDQKGGVNYNMDGVEKVPENTDWKRLAQTDMKEYMRLKQVDHNYQAEFQKRRQAAQAQQQASGTQAPDRDQADVANSQYQKVDPNNNPWNTQAKGPDPMAQQATKQQTVQPGQQQAFPNQQPKPPGVQGAAPAPGAKNTPSAGGQAGATVGAPAQQTGAGAGKGAPAAPKAQPKVGGGQPPARAGEGTKAPAGI